MNRRQMLATLGVALGGVAGCLSGDRTESPDSPGPGADDTPTPTATAADETPGLGTPEDIVVEKAVTYESLMGSGGVLAPDGRQFVVASLAERTAEESATFTFETDDDSWSTGIPDTVGAGNASVAGHARPYLAFTVPSPLSGTDPHIRRSDGLEWPLSADTRATLTAPAPEYELDELSVPDSVSQGESLSVTLTATNVSGTDGRFLAALYWPTRRIADDDESHIVERTVAAGETTTASLDIDTSYTATAAGPVTLTVRGHVSAGREVRVENVGTDS